MHTPSYLIVGGGVAGLSTAWHLARRGGARVTVLEREGRLGAQSSGKNAGILRTAAGDPVEVELATRGARFLKDPHPGFSSVPLVDPCGLYLTATAQAETLERWTANCPREVRHELDSGEGLRAAAPHFDGSFERAYYFPDEGRLDVAALIDSYAEGARRAGARIETSAAVVGLVYREGRVGGVELEDGRVLLGDAVIVAAGAWAERLGRSVGSRLRLRPTRRHLLVTAESDAVDPGWPVIWGVDDSFYVRPEGRGLLLCACDESDVDLDDEPDAPDPDVERRIRARASELVPDHARLATRRFWPGLRTFSEDGRFLVGWDPDLHGLFWVGGLGGAGMVTSYEVGRLAAKALWGEPACELTRALDPARFASEAAV